MLERKESLPGLGVNLELISDAISSIGIAHYFLSGRTE